MKYSEAKKHTPFDWRRFLIPGVVFLTGACILIIEVVATRLLSPYFGNTIYTVSSVLSVVLAALSIGYYFGGRLADKHPSKILFYALILSGGAAVAVLSFLTFYILPSIGYRLPIIGGTLLTSSILFLIPCTLLGMLSPFAVKLQLLRFPTQGAGTVSGEIFFFSTLGSIAGSLSTGFMLVPAFGAKSVIIGTAIFLVLLGTLPLIWLTRLGRKRINILLMVSLFAIACSVTPQTQQDRRLIYQKDGVYERLTISEGTYRDRPTRFFYQDRTSSGAMFLDGSELAYDYTKAYRMHTLSKAHTGRSLVLGAAATYSIPKALLADNPHTNVTVAEIEPSLPSLAKQYFNVPDTNRLTTRIEDGRRLLATSPQTYDFVFSDVYSSLYSVPTHLTTKEFFSLAKQRLSPNGIFVANLIGNAPDKGPSFIAAELKTMQSVFPETHFYGIASPDTKELQNIIAVGLKQSHGTPFSQLMAGSQDEYLRSLATRSLRIPSETIARQSILTDDHAPVEQLVARMIQNRER